MFVLAVKFKAAEGKEKELVQLFSRVQAQVRQNEPDTLMYDLHHKIDDPSEVFLYERYKDRQACEVTHNSALYIKELRAELTNYLGGATEVTQYETIELKQE